LKLPEVARRLGVSEKTARRYVKAGDLPSVFVGNAYRVSEEDVERYLRQARVPAGGESPKKAQAPPPPEDGERGPFDFKEARDGLERYCERWERILAENELDDRDVEEFFATADGWIAVLDVAVRAEIDELHRATGLVESVLFAKSEIRRANLRYLDVFSGFVEVLRRRDDKILADPTSAGANVVRLLEVRERLVGMQNEAAG